MPKELLFEVTDDVGVITFDREHARNALTLAMYEELAEISQSIIDGRTKLRALVITGAGNKAFAAGTDINSFDQLSSPDDALDYERLMDRVLELLEQVPVPTIAAIQGACTGGGAAIVRKPWVIVCPPGIWRGLSILSVRIWLGK